MTPPRRMSAAALRLAEGIRKGARPAVVISTLDVLGGRVSAGGRRQLGTHRHKAVRCRGAGSQSTAESPPEPRCTSRGRNVERRVTQVGPRDRLEMRTLERAQPVLTNKINAFDWICEHVGRFGGWREEHGLMEMTRRDVDGDCSCSRSGLPRATGDSFQSRRRRRKNTPRRLPRFALGCSSVPQARGDRPR